MPSRATTSRLRSPTPARACRPTCRRGLRSLLHHQADRAGHRPGPLHGLWLRAPVRRPSSRIDSELGRGHDRQPLSAAAYGAARADGARTPQRRPARGAGETVLVVEDEPPVRMLVTTCWRSSATGRSRRLTAPAGLQILRSRRAHRPADHRRRPAGHERPAARRRRARTTARPARSCSSPATPRTPRCARASSRPAWR